MKILGISASNRKWGNTDILVRHVLRGADQEGAETQFIRLIDFEIQQCRGCLSCIFKDKECVIDDQLSELLGILRKADGVVLGSPIYIMSAAGAIQNLTARLFRQGYNGELAGKPGIAIAVGGKPGWEGFAIYQVMLFFLSLGMPLVDRFMGYGQGPGEVFDDAEACERALEGGKAMASGQTAFRGESGICPVCHGYLVLNRDKNQPWCMLCDLPGRWMKKGAMTQFEPLAGSSSRWGVKQVRAHFENLILPSRNRFRAKREEIRKKLEAFRTYFEHEIEGLGDQNGHHFK